MIMKKYILTKIFIIFGFVATFATPQIPDKLVYNGNTFYTYLSLPRECYKKVVGFLESPLKVNIFGTKKPCMSTACGNGYRATWEIIENQLYLTGIYSCCYYEDSIKADLSLLFKNKVKNGMVKADWVTTMLFVYGGKKIADIDALSIYEKSYEFEFRKGKLLNVKSYDNSKSKQSIYSYDSEMLINFIYSNIDWNNIPKQRDATKIVVQFSANEFGKIDSAKVVRGDNEILNKEAIRVIKLIPEWDVFYIKGQHFRIKWTFPIIFSERNREKYKK